MSEKKGRFIVFEGLDGAGKTTQIRLLEDRLLADGRKVFRTAEPTDFVSGKLLRQALSGERSCDAAEMAAMFLWDRICHNTDPEAGIRRMLSDGYDVICDRYYYSSLAYQGSATSGEWVADMNLHCPEILRPDLCIFLDLTPEQSMERINRGRAAHEIYENTETLRQVQKQFYRALDLLKETDRICTVNAARSVEAISEEIYRKVCEL